MIDAGTVFDFCRWLARAGWLILLLSLFMPKARPMAWPTTQFVLPAILCAAYLLLVAMGFATLREIGYAAFSSLGGLRSLYADDGAIAASWVHFLAFDLFAGTWMVRDGLARRMPVALIFLCLPFTYLLGPSGLLLYILLRYALHRRAPPETA